MKLDLKSFLCGCVTVLLALLAIGAGSDSTVSGRYQVTGFAPYFMLVDTTTGRVWTANFTQANKTTDADFFAPKN